MRTRAAALVIAVLALGAGACDDHQCPNESFVVDEVGSCSGEARQLTLGSYGCSVSLTGPSGPTGLPARGALDENERPLRQGGFILYDSAPAFLLCTAHRVDFRLELACVDGSGASVCDATLTEPSP